MDNHLCMRDGFRIAIVPVLIAQYSTGTKHVLVAGVFVVRDEEIVNGVRPGKAIRRTRGN